MHTFIFACIGCWYYIVIILHGLYYVEPGIFCIQIFLPRMMFRFIFILYVLYRMGPRLLWLSGSDISFLLSHEIRRSQYLCL